MKTTKAIVPLCAVALALLGTGRARATTWGSLTCSFADPSAIGAVYAQSRTQFLVWSKNASTTCNPGEAGCHFYVQSPIVAPSLIQDIPAIHVDPTVYPEAHLVFEDPRLAAFECTTPDPDGLGGGFGRRVNGTCPVVNWANEPRYLFAHAANETFKVWIEGLHLSFVFGRGARWQSTGKRVFDLTSFRNRGTKNITLVIHAADDGNWYTLDGLAPGVNDVSGFAWFIDEAHFTSAGNAEVQSIDDIVTQTIRL
jgi:hypothetical protein